MVESSKMSGNNGLGDELEDMIIQALSHRERRNILKIVDSMDGGVVYSNILGETGLSTGRLNYHLKELGGFVEKDEERMYRLTSLGKKAIRLMREIREDLDESYEVYASVARTNSRSFIQRNLNRAFYVAATLLLTAPLVTTYLFLIKPSAWWKAIIMWSIYFVLLYLMDRGRKGSLKHILAFIDWLEWRLFDKGRNGGRPGKFPGSKMVIGLIIGIVVGEVIGKTGAGLLLGLFLGATM